jgi:hypothetical protein
VRSRTTTTTANGLSRITIRSKKTITIRLIYPATSIPSTAVTASSCSYQTSIRSISAAAGTATATAAFVICT